MQLNSGGSTRLSGNEDYPPFDRVLPPTADEEEEGDEQEAYGPVDAAAFVACEPDFKKGGKFVLGGPNGEKAIFREGKGAKGESAIQGKGFPRVTVSKNVRVGKCKYTWNGVSSNGKKNIELNACGTRRPTNLPKAAVDAG
ncbi:MAG: hypothetical protein AAF581_16535 [Planctomycetota bacterium]